MSTIECVSNSDHISKVALCYDSHFSCRLSGTMQREVGKGQGAETVASLLANECRRPSDGCSDGTLMCLSKNLSEHMLMHVTLAPKR